MSNVPTNLIPTKITGLPEYVGSSTLGYLPYVLEGRTYKVQFANIAAVGAVPSTREINTGSGLGGGGDLSANRTLYILPGGVDDSRLSTTGVTAGTYGSADTIPVFTVNAQGRVTGVTDTPIVLSGYVPTSRTITAGAGLSGGGDLSANRSFAVNFSSTTPEPLGTGSSGVSNVAAREDHVHPAVDLSDTTETQGVLPLSRGGTGNSLSPVAGAIVYSSNDRLYLTTAGSVGQVLRSGGPGGVPFWSSIGAGTVTSVSVATANGFAGTVADPTASPVITVSTTVTGVIKGDGTAISAATAGTDYVAPGAYTTSGLTMATSRLLGRTTALTGAAEEITVGTGLLLSGGSLTNSAPDQTVSLTAGTAISISGTYPSFTVTNTAPDQLVSLTGAGGTSISGTYPNFTITSSTAGGTVTSVSGSGGTTGLTLTGGPITTTGTLTLGGTLAVANGGTGATDAATALANLGAYPASNPSGFTSNTGTVTSVAGSGGTTGLTLTGGPITATGTLTLGGTLTIANGGTGATDAATALTNLGAYPASNPSGFTSNTGTVTSVGGTGTVNGITLTGTVSTTGSLTLGGTLSGVDLTTQVSGTLPIANGGTNATSAGAALTNLGGAASGANTDITSIALTTGTITTAPASNNDIVNKSYVDTLAASGIHFHQPVRVEAPINLNATYNNGTSGVGATLTNAGTQAALVIDGVTVSVADRVLIYSQTTQTQNGIYVVTDTGSGSTNWVLTRSSDANTYVINSANGLSEGSTVFVQQGATGAGETYTCNTSGVITFGTTAITFAQISSAQIYSAGTGLTLTSTTFSITNTGVTANTYGSASSVPVLAINAQGQATGATDTPIAIAGSQITSGSVGLLHGGTGATSAPTARTNLGATTVGSNFFTLTDPSAITFIRVNADNSVSTLDAASFRTAIGAGSGGGSVTSVDVSGGSTGLTATGGPITTSGTITLSGTLAAANGGTGQTSYTVGDLIYASGTTALAKLSDVATGNALISGGVGVAPSYGKIGLTTHVSGTLEVGNGGTGSTTLTGYVKGNGTSAFTASATIPGSDITSEALTKTDDTNVTLTLGGSPTTALLAATSLTLGWTGQLAVSRGGTGASTLTANGVLLGNGTSSISATAVGATGEVLVGNTGAAPTWATLSSSAVTSFSGGTTGLTPSTATTGAITLGGTLDVANGGTGATSLTGYIKGSGTSAFTAASTIPASDISSGAALTKTDDTNVTLTLGGSPTTALLAATSITAGWTGELSASRGGTGLSSPGTLGNVLTSNGTAWVSSPPTAGGITYTSVKTSAYTAAANEGVQTDTSGGVFTVNLPATPATGAQVFIVDSANSWATNNLTVGRNGSTIEGSASDLICDISAVSVQFVYNGSTWDVFAQVGGAGGGLISVPGGGTGVSTLSSGYLLKGNGTSPVTASVVYDDGTNVGIGTSSPTVGAGYTSVSLRNSTGGNIDLGVGSTIYGQWLATSSASRLLASNGAYQTFETGGAERMRIDTVGSVGIGTSSPGAKLDVVGLSSTDIFRVTRGTTYLQAGVTDGLGAEINVYQTTFGVKRLYLQSAGGTTYFGGDVGLATTAPQGKMEIRTIFGGTVTNALTLSNYVGSSVGTGVALYFDPNGAGSVARAASIQSVQATSGNYADLRLFTANSDTPAERMRISPAGIVYVNTTSTPSFGTPKLVVDGNISGKGTVTVNSSTATTIAEGAGLLLLIRNTTNGGTAVVSYENAQTPVIISTSGGTTFQTGAPSGSAQIQLTNRSGNLGVAALASGDRTGNVLSVTVLQVF